MHRLKVHGTRAAVLVYNGVNGSTNDESSDSDEAPDVDDAMVKHVAPADD